jgi:hypothetical protein
MFDIVAIPMYFAGTITLMLSIVVAWFGSERVANWMLCASGVFFLLMAFAVIVSVHLR